MGIRSGFFVFLRPSCYGDSERTGRPGTREKEIGFERDTFGPWEHGGELPRPESRFVSGEKL